MIVKNIHERNLKASPAKVGILIDSLASDNDLLEFTFQFDRRDEGDSFSILFSKL